MTAAKKAPKAPTTIDHVVTQADLDANPDLVTEGVTVGETIQIPNPDAVAEAPKAAKGSVVVEYKHAGAQFSRTFDSKEDATAFIKANPAADATIVDESLLPTVSEHQAMQQNELMRKKNASSI